MKSGGWLMPAIIAQDGYGLDKGGERRGRFTATLRDTGFQDVTLEIDGPSQGMPLTADVGYACLRLTKTASRCHCHCGLRRMASDRRFRILWAK